MTKQLVTGAVEWVKMCNWEGFLTVRIPPTISPRSAPNEVITSVIRPLAKHLKLRLAALMVFTLGHAKHGPHAHILLVSRSGQLSGRLREGEDFLKSTRTIINSHKDAIKLEPYIEYGDFLENGHAEYAAKHVIDDGDVQFYGFNIIKEQKK